MSLGKRRNKTEHAGTKNGGGHWGTRAEAKQLSKKHRRSNDKQEVKNELFDGRSKTTTNIATSKTREARNLTKAELPKGYELRILPVEEFRPIFEQNRPKIFGKNLDFHLQEALSSQEKRAMKTLRARMGSPYYLCLCLYFHGKLVGWSFGRQEDGERFYMINSAIFPEHRNKGLYRSLLKKVLHETTVHGFQVIYSRHTATNSTILIPKLKAGFVITSFEISDVFGVLVHLSYFANPIRRKAMDFRSGQAIPDQELRGFLSL